MNRLVVLVLVAVLGGCAAPSIPTTYTGPDSGTVVVGIGATSETSYSSYTLLARPRTPAPSERAGGVARLVFYQSNIFHKQKPDYQSDSEAGVVLVASMPAGEYEVFNFEVFHHPFGSPGTIYSSQTPFSIPFTVKPGTTAYLGNFQARNVRGRNLLNMPMNAGAIFAVSDRQTADVALARARRPSISSSENFTPRPPVGRSPFFVAP